MSTSALKKRLAASQDDRVEELKAASTPTGRRPRTLVETELEVVAEGEPAPEPPALTVVAEAVDVLTADGEPSVQSTSDAGDTGQRARTEGVRPAAVHTKPARKTGPQVGTAVGEEAWRRFVTPPAARGTSVNTTRINIPVSEALIDRINELDYRLAMDGSRWVINRNDLLGTAVQMLLDDPDRWEAEYLARRADLPPTPATLQGRITAEAFAALKRTRFTRQGKRPTGTLLSVIVEQLLAASPAP